MTVVFAAVCGLIQGLSEFLPISSSGHLALFQRLFFRDPEARFLAFNVVLHLGTLAAVTIILRRDVVRVLRGGCSAAAKAARGRLRFRDCTPDERTAIALLCATVPMALAKLIDDRVETLACSVTAVGVILILNGAMLALSDRIPRGSVDGSAISLPVAFKIGFAQCAAVLPGLSRSGASVTAGLACRLDREYAVRFSFLLSIPAILGAALLEIPGALRAGIPSPDGAAYAVGACVAFISGAAAMKALIYLSRRSSFRVFAVYSAAIGAAAVILGAAGVRFPVS